MPEISQYIGLYKKIYNAICRIWDNKIRGDIIACADTDMMGKQISIYLSSYIVPIVKDKYRLKLDCYINYHIRGFVNIVFWLDNGKTEIINMHVNVIDGQVRDSWGMSILLPRSVIPDIGFL